MKDDQNPTLALVRACAFVVVLAIALVGIVVIAGEFVVSGSDQVTLAKRTTGSASAALDAAPSSNDLSRGMPLP
jgi:hypothetical protein